MDDKSFEEGRTATVTYWALGQMLRGAGMAFVLVVELFAMIGLIFAISHLLPDQSKQMPSPYGGLLMPMVVQVA